MMKRLLSLLFFTLFIISAGWCQAESAGYATVIGKFKKFYNNKQPDSIYKMFNAEMRKSVPYDQFLSATTALQGQFGNMESTKLDSYNQPVATYNAAFQKGVLVLSMSLNSQQQIIGLLFNQPKAETAPAADPSVIESPVFLKTLAGTIAGTLTMPKNASGKVPIVIIVAGSGPTDRDGNNAKEGINGNTYKLLADELGKNNIACLRYDKRMVGQTTGTQKESKLQIDDYMDDATSLIIMLNEDQRFSKIVVLGHGEGALVGMNASVGEPVSAFISISGAGEPADKTLTEQMKSEPAYKADGFKTILDSLRKGKLTDKVDPALYYIARPSIQPYLMSWFRHDPIRDIKKLKIPILIIQGNNDLRETVADAEKLKKAKSDATLTVIPGMNYVMRDAPTDRDKNRETYTKPDLPLKPELVTAVVGFVSKLK